MIELITPRPLQDRLEHLYGVIFSEDQIERLVNLAFMVAHKDRVAEIVGKRKSAKMHKHAMTLFEWKPR